MGPCLGTIEFEFHANLDDDIIATIVALYYLPPVGITFPSTRASLASVFLYSEPKLPAELLVLVVHTVGGLVRALKDSIVEGQPAATLLLDPKSKADLDLTDCDFDQVLQRFSSPCAAYHLQNVLIVLSAFHS